MDIVKQIAEEQIRTDLPEIKVGDNVKFMLKFARVTGKECKCLKVPSFP